jgi:hypothetical protein
MIVVQPVGGLCNYLRVVFSYYKIASLSNDTLTVIWLKDDACNGYFLDYFKPIQNITFEYNNMNNYKIDYFGCNAHHDYNAHFKLKYENLELVPEINEIIINKQKILGNYIAVHIRRTDSIENAKLNNQYTTDDCFFNFIDNKLKDKKLNLYIATDNIETYNIFKAKYGNLVKFDYHKTINGLRHTSLRDAIIDLYMCINSDYFLGSGFSSFTNMINDIRVCQYNI